MFVILKLISNGSGITYQPGDALGVWYENSSDLVSAILDQVGLSGIESIELDGESFIYS